MKRAALLSAGFVIALMYGCAGPSLSVDPSRTLVPALEASSMKAFGRAVQAEAGSPALERARIDYLLERVSKSPYNFFRNGGRYTGGRALAHLKWKYFRNLGRVKTAEDFIERVATRSKMSGQAYEVEYRDRKRYPLRSVLLMELALLDEAVQKEWKRIQEEVEKRESAAS